MTSRIVLAGLAGVLASGTAAAQQQEPARATLLLPARVFDGVGPRGQSGWAVLVRGDRIEAVGPRAELRVPLDAATVELPGTTLLPGLIDAHSHLLLHPYNETSWDDQPRRPSVTRPNGRRRIVRAPLAFNA